MAIIKYNHATKFPIHVISPLNIINQHQGQESIKPLRILRLSKFEVVIPLTISCNYMQFTLNLVGILHLEVEG